VGPGLRGALPGALASAALLAAVLPGGAGAQGLADFDYENLSFQGGMLDIGYIFPAKVDDTQSFGGRVDLGLLGPGVRVTFGFNRWSSFLTEEEVRRLEDSVAALILEQSGETATVDLGAIKWSDVALHGDMHLLWQVPFGLLTYAGLGASAHVLRGGGSAVDETFVDDLLDSVRAGINVHGGLEVPVGSRLRVVGEGRYELLEDLSYFQVRAGLELLFGG
jgi:hypothetical protein